jgi:hypothetical protein
MKPDAIRSFYHQYSASGNQKGHTILSLSDEMLTWVSGVFSEVSVSSPPPGPQWSSLIEIAKEQGFLGFLYYRISTAKLQSILPESIYRELKREYHQYCVRSFAYEKQVCSLAHSLCTAGIEHLFLKGPALGYQIYQSPNLRPFRDIDLLIRPDDFRAVSGILQRLHYHSTFDAFSTSSELYHHQVFLPPLGSGYLPVELHWRPLYNPVHQSSISFDALYCSSDLVSTPLGEIRSLSPEDALIYACVHMSIQHAGEIRLIWMIDILLLINKIKQQNLWNCMAERIQLWNAGAVVKRTGGVICLWFESSPLIGSVEWDAFDDGGSEDLNSADRVSSGKEHKIWTQVHKMPTLAGKGRAIFHYFAATRAVHRTGKPANVLEYFNIWLSIVRIVMQRWRDG